MKTKKARVKQKNWPKMPVFQIFGFLFLAVISVLITTYVSYQLAYEQKIFPGVRVLGINVGNKTPSEAKNLLDKKLKGKVELADLDLLVQKAYLIGRGPDFIDNSTQKVAAWFDHYDLKTKSLVVKPLLTGKTQTNKLNLLGVGQSKFVGSPPERVTNISVASSLVNGTVVRPGENFSFYKVIGSLGPERGFREADLIYGGSIQKGQGGGICQVSTTLYRAALNSNLPIVERWPHSLRISYYEQDSPPGFDAAVYFPESDFRFQNNTQDDLVIKTYLDPISSSLKVELYTQASDKALSLSQSSGY